ncbi:unnamed protein product, partial [Choristocarpus tenellus]
MKVPEEDHPSPGGESIGVEAVSFLPVLFSPSSSMHCLPPDTPGGGSSRSLWGGLEQSAAGTGGHQVQSTFPLSSRRPHCAAESCRGDRGERHCRSKSWSSSPVESRLPRGTIRTPRGSGSVMGEGCGTAPRVHRSCSPSPLPLMCECCCETPPHVLDDEKGDARQRTRILLSGGDDGRRHHKSEVGVVGCGEKGREDHDGCGEGVEKRCICNRNRSDGGKGINKATMNLSLSSCRSSVLPTPPLTSSPLVSSPLASPRVVHRLGPTPRAKHNRGAGGVQDDVEQEEEELRGMRMSPVVSVTGVRHAMRCKGKGLCGKGNETGDANISVESSTCQNGCRNMYEKEGIARLGGAVSDDFGGRKHSRNSRERIKARSRIVDSFAESSTRSPWLSTGGDDGHAGEGHRRGTDTEQKVTGKCMLARHESLVTCRNGLRKQSRTRAASSSSLYSQSADLARHAPRFSPPEVHAHLGSGLGLSISPQDAGQARHEDGDDEMFRVGGGGTARVHGTMGGSPNTLTRHRHSHRGAGLAKGRRMLAKGRSSGEVVDDNNDHLFIERKRLGWGGGQRERSPEHMNSQE